MGIAGWPQSPLRSTHGEMRYQSSLETRPPQMRPLDGLVTPYGDYPSTHADAFRSRAGQIAADYNVAGDKANTDYELDRQRAENALVLQGLNTLADDEQRQRQVRDSRLDMMRGLQRSLIGGLFE
jgi:hypothetical protein